jgi:hypothetical protein
MRSSARTTRAAAFSCVSAVALLVLGCGCGGGSDATPTPGPVDIADAAPIPLPADTEPATPFACDPAELVPEQGLQRLSLTQYQSRLRELVEVVAPEHSAAILSELRIALAALPRDLRGGQEPDYGGLRRLDQSIYAESVDGSYAVAVALGEALTARPERLRAVAGECAVDADAGNDQACVDAFIQKLGKLVLRRPLSAEDQAFYRQVAYADIVTLLASSPYFLYAVELGGTALTAHELAARLALHFWHGAPDEQLMAAADSGALLELEVYAQQVERVYADAKTERMLEELFVDWLEPKHLEELHVRIGSFDYDALRSDFTPGPELKSRMLRELGRMGVYYAHRTASTFAEMFQSRSSFAETADLAEIYGVPVWDGSSEPPTFPDAERTGLLTRAALVATGHGTSHPIFKGVYARKTVLCETIPPPPADANVVARAARPGNITSRAVTEALSSARADCAGCHVSLINPVGFNLEHFDGLGRFRALERVYDPLSGVLLAEEPVRSQAVPRVVPDDLREAEGAADLHRFMIESGKPQLCFARRYFRYTFAREEDDARDGCVLNALLRPLLAGESLGTALRAVALQPAFRERRLEP